MAGTLLWLADAGALAWLIVLVLPWQPWRNREVLRPEPRGADISDVTVLIPARDEAAVIGRTLAALDGDANARTLRVLVVDDDSRDGTAEIARGCGLAGLEVLRATPTPAGWSGKLWALECGLGHVTTPLVLLLDADIELCNGVIPALRHRLEKQKLGLISVMACLRTNSRWERLLAPAFVYFFRLLYPFALANRQGSRIAAAAGGCALVRAHALRDIGGFSALHDALIDDCTLARRIKDSGWPIWIGLSPAVQSLRSAVGMAELWNMVARTAYAQLRHSLLLLVMCTLIMAAMFMALPVATLVAPSVLRGAGCVAMAVSYLPMLRFYRLSPIYAGALPVTGTLFLLMTWTSALRHWRGAGVRWKGRNYTKAH